MSIYCSVLVSDFTLCSPVSDASRVVCKNAGYFRREGEAEFNSQ